MNQELFTAESLGTQGGLTLFVIVATNSLRSAFRFNPRWMGLILALIACLIVEFSLLGDSKYPVLLRGFIAIGNAFLVYLAAVGSNSAATAVLTKKPPRDEDEAKVKAEPEPGGAGLPRLVQFFHPWW